MKKRKALITMSILTLSCMLLLAGCGSDMPYSGLNYKEYVKLGTYTGIEVDDYSISVSKSEIADAINEDLEAAVENKTLKKGTKIKDGDTVNIDYVGRINGKKFDNGSDEGYDLEIGSGSFIDGFEDGLIGKKVGQKKIKLKVTFPDDYSSEDLQGKDAVFTVTINSATRPETPEYNDEFAQSQGDYETTAEYEKAVEQELYDEKEEEAISDQKTAIWEEVLENSKMKKYPEEELASYIETFDNMMEYYATQYGTDKDTLLSTYYGISSDEDAEAYFEDQAKQLIKQEMIIEYIAEKEELSYTKDEAKELKASLTQQGYDDASMQRDTGRDMDQYVHINLLYEKVQDFLLDNAKVKK